MAKSLVEEVGLEIINDSQVEPRRLQVILQLVSELPSATKEEIFQLAQLPIVLDNAPDLPKNLLLASENTYKHAVDCKQVSENDDKTLSLLVDPESITTMPAFRDHIREVIFGITDINQPNYVFNLFSAWYAVQNEKILHELVQEECCIAFTTDLPLHFFKAKERAFNTTKLSAWRKWAEFLGLGWTIKIGSHSILIPDATKRVRSILPEVLSNGEEIRFGIFMERLAVVCPELDGGKLFRDCWQASRGEEVQGNRLSLMLSTALRTLATLHIIELFNRADSLDVWQLYPSQGSLYKQVTHIRLQGA
jgi:hypothetical protein